MTEYDISSYIYLIRTKRDDDDIFNPLRIKTQKDYTTYYVSKFIENTRYYSPM